MNAIEERGEQVIFGIEVAVPLSEAAAFAAAMTGNDDDIVLAAEQAMRERLDDGTLASGIELLVRSEDVVRPFLADVLGRANDMGRADGLGA